MNITIVGAGRAGSSFASAFTRVGHDVDVVHHDDVSSIAETQLIILCVPDDAIADVATSIAPREDRVVAHVAGSRTLEVLAPHPRVGLAAPPDGAADGERRRSTHRRDVLRGRR